MSADNLYVIRNHPKGGYAVKMAFASDIDNNGEQLYPEVDQDDEQYETYIEALYYASKQDSEYGVDDHPEIRG